LLFSKFIISGNGSIIRWRVEYVRFVVMGPILSSSLTWQNFHAIQATQKIISDHHMILINYVSHMILIVTQKNFWCKWTKLYQWFFRYIANQKMIEIARETNDAIKVGSTRILGHLMQVPGSQHHIISLLSYFLEKYL
jgi:hypothetical protein